MILSGRYKFKNSKQLKNDRGNAKIDQCLQLLNDKASGGENLMPAVIDAVENKVTLGEIARRTEGAYLENTGSR